MATYDPTFRAPTGVRRAINVGGFNDTIDAGSEMVQSSMDASADRISTAVEDASRPRGELLAGEFAINDETGEVMLADGQTFKMNAPTMVRLATLKNRDGSPLQQIDPNTLPTGWRTYAQGQLRADIDAIDSDSDFWGEAWSSFKSGIGLAASALDAQIGNDDPSNTWSRSGREYSDNQTLAQYKASNGVWFTGIDEFMAGLGQTVGNIGSSAALAAPAIATGVGAIAVGGTAASGGAQAYGEQATDFYDAAMEAMAKMSPEQLQAESPLFQQVMMENPGIDPEEAKREVAIRGARSAGAAGALPGAVEAAIGGRLAGNILAKVGYRTALAGAAKERAAKSLGRTVAGWAGRGGIGGVAAVDPADAEAAFNRWPDVYQPTTDGRTPIWAKRHGLPNA